MPFACLFLFTLFACTFACAQQPVFYNYTTNQGLPASETYDILQDQRGYIWVSTDRGVSRFDGYSFKNFTTSEGLLDNTVLSMFEDQKGRIWFHGLSGRICYYQDGKIWPYAFNQALSSERSYMIRSFYCDTNDNVVVGTFGRGLTRVDRKGKAQRIDHCILNGRCYQAHIVNDRLFLSTAACGKSTFSNITFFDGHTELLTPVKRSEAVVQLNIAGVKRKNGTCVIYGEGDIVEIKNGKITGQYKAGNVIRIFEDSDSCLWVSSRMGGVRRYAPNEGYASPHFEVFLKNHSVTCVYEDTEKGYWMATLSSGLFYFPSMQVNVYRFPEKYAVTALTAMGENQVMAGFLNGLMIHLDTTGIRKIYNLNSGSDSVNNIYSICLHGREMLVSTARGLYLVNKNIEWISNRGETYSRCMQFYNDAYYGTGHTVWFSVRDKKPKRLAAFNIHAELFYIDRDGKMWIGDPTGLYYLKDSVPVKAYPENAALNERVSGIEQMPDGKLVVSTIGKGIVIIQNGRFDHIDTKNGLASSIVNSITLRGNGIWVGTNKGISVITGNGKNRDVQNFSLEHGLPESEIRKVVFTGDRLWAITKKQLFSFVPDRLKKNPIPPPVYIEQVFTRNKKQFLPSSPAEILHDEFPVQIHYRGLAYKKRGAVLYRYRVRGLSNSWQYTYITYVEFHSLPAGDYVLEVAAQNEDGKWNAVPAVFKWTVIPPFWKTWWFLMACVGLLLVMVVLIFYARVRHIRNKNEIINTMLTYRQQALLNQMNPHFIFNSLNSIQTFILVEEKKLATRYISKFARLMRLTLNHSRSEFVLLVNEMASIALYMELEKLRFKDLFDYEIRVDDSIDQRSIQVPPMIIQPYLENCIKHAFGDPFTGKGFILLSIRFEKDLLMCMIEDNGIGRARSLKQEKHTQHESAGTTITQQRLQLTSRSLKQDFYLEFIDKTDANMEPSGTIVIFAMPYRVVAE